MVDLPIKQYRRFDSFKEYEALFDKWVPLTQATIRVFEQSLSRNWNSPERNALLRHFLREDATRRLQILLHDKGSLERELPRLIDTLRDFSHGASVRLTPKVARHIYDPFVVFDASHYLHRFHHAHMRAAEGTHDVESAADLLQRHAEMWEISASVPIASAGAL
jgi:hypothetical protein